MVNKFFPGRKRLCKKIPAPLSWPDELLELSRADTTSEAAHPHCPPHSCTATRLPGSICPLTNPSDTNEVFFCTSTASSAPSGSLTIISFTTVLVAFRPGSLVLVVKNALSPPSCHWATPCLGSPAALPQHWVLPASPTVSPWDASTGTQPPNKGAVMRQAPRCCSLQTVCHLDLLCSGKPLSLQIFVFKCFSAHLIQACAAKKKGNLL